MSMIGNCRALSASELAMVIADPEAAEALAYPEDGEAEKHLDLDKSWHLIHFLLAGKTWEGELPLANVILGGRELPDTDAGYGPFRYLLPSEVAEVSDALSKVTPDVLWSRFDAEKALAAEIYPQSWAGDEGDREYVKHHYQALQVHFATAKADQCGMLLYIS